MRDLTGIIADNFRFDYFFGPYSESVASIWASVAEQRCGTPQMTFSVEHHDRACPHSSGGSGWYAVARNEQGERWTGAPWESHCNGECWP